MYEVNDGSTVESHCVAKILVLRAALISMPADELHAYLKKSATDTSATARVLRELVSQALNVKAAESRKAAAR